jgi:hypothetical protein
MHGGSHLGYGHLVSRLDHQAPGWLQDSRQFLYCTEVHSRECSERNLLQVDLRKNLGLKRQPIDITLHVRPGAGAEIEGNIPPSEFWITEGTSPAHDEPTYSRRRYHCKTGGKYSAIKSS